MSAPLAGAVSRQPRWRALVMREVASNRMMLPRAGNRHGRPRDGPGLCRGRVGAQRPGEAKRDTTTRV
jgi:hypothetical protein